MQYVQKTVIDIDIDEVFELKIPTGMSLHGSPDDELILEWAGRRFAIVIDTSTDNLSLEEIT